MRTRKRIGSLRLINAALLMLIAVPVARAQQSASSSPMAGIGVIWKDSVNGVDILIVVPNSAAWVAGIHVGDTVLSIDQVAGRALDLTTYLQSIPLGSPVGVKCLRAGAVLRFQVVTGDYDELVPSDDNNASLVDTMKFVQDVLGSGAISYIYRKDSVPTQIVEKYSRVVGDPQSCRLTYHEEITPNTGAMSSPDRNLDLRGIQQLAVISTVDKYKNVPVVYDPTLFELQIKMAGNDTSLFVFHFLDPNLADDVARAMLHAVNLCGAR